MSDTIRLQVRPDSNTVIVTGATITGGTNIGTGVGIYDGIVGKNLTFKTLEAGSNITIAQSGDEIQISAGITGGTVVTDVIAGTEIGVDKTDPSEPIVSFTGGSNYVGNDTFTGYTATTDTRLETIEGDITGNTAQILINKGAITANTESININASGITDNYNLITGNTEAITGKVDLTGDTMTGTLGIPALLFDTTGITAVHQAGKMHWLEPDGTVSIGLNKGVRLQIGQETLIIGEAVEDLIDGDVISSYGFKPDGKILLGKADIQAFGVDFYTGNDVGVMTSNALSGETGYATIYGRVRSVDTSAWTGGTTLWLSNTVRGSLTNVKPVYPEASIPMAFVAIQDATNGELVVNPVLDLIPQINSVELTIPYFAYTFIDRISMTTTVSGGTVFLNVANADTGKTTMTIIKGIGDFLTFNNQSIPLQAGTDSVPILNYVSFTDTGATVQTGWFTGNKLDTSGSFCAIATVLVQSVANVTSNNVYKCHGWIDRLTTNDRGDNVKVGERLREVHAQWDNGVLPTVVHTPATVDRIDISTAEGIIYQKNRNVFPILTTVGNVDPIFWANHFTTPYKELTNIGEIDQLSDGSTPTNNDWSQFVVWGVSSQNTGQCKLYVNVSNNDYNTKSQAFNDRDNYADYHIPDEFIGTGFLIARITAQWRDGGTEWDNLGDVIDLRGKLPDTIAGGGLGGGGEIGVKNSIERDVDLLYQLVNDVSGTTTNKYYGFDSGGTRGYHDLTGITATKADKTLTIVSLTGTTTLDATYEGKMIEATGTFTITFPTGLATGWNVSITNVGTGTITYAANGTIQSKDSAVTTTSQYAGVVAYHRGSDNIILVGDLA